jgi:adenine deaminase
MFPDPLLTLATLTGAAIPYLRICEEGLVNIKDGKARALFVEASADT